eukprot:scaffold36809_cov18-Tisochrysis_lutea.AAC.1
MADASAEQEHCQRIYSASLVREAHPDQCTRSGQPDPGIGEGLLQIKVASQKARTGALQGTAVKGLN